MTSISYNDNNNNQNNFEERDLQLMKSNGIYIPPFKLRRSQTQLKEEEGSHSESWQRNQWQELRKSITGPINKANVHNIKQIVVELLQVNIIRGRGLFCESLMNAQIASPTFTPVYASLTAVINTKFPEIGELLCKRLISKFQKCYKTNNKPIMKCMVLFIAHLTNHQIIHDLLCLQIMTLLLNDPNNDSVEICKDLILESGNALLKLAPSAMKSVMHSCREILQESTNIALRIQYELDSLFESYKHSFEDHPAIIDQLDIVDEDDHQTHNLTLMEKHEIEKMVDVFHFDPNWEIHEQQYTLIKREILGESDSESEMEDEIMDQSHESKDTYFYTQETDEDIEENDGKLEIHDLTNQTVLNLRRKIYLTFVSSLTAQEMAHKILKNFNDCETHVATMVLEACQHERSYRAQFGLLAERLSKLKIKYEDAFDELFPKSYANAHLLDTNKIRNVARFYAHLLASDALDWNILQFIQLSEQETNPSKRIFIKILFQELASIMGEKLRPRFEMKIYGDSFDGIFPRDDPKNTRFSINFLSTIGLGGLTEDMRRHLKSYQKKILKQQQEEVSDSDSDESSSSNSSSGEESSSESESDSSDSESDSSDGSKKVRRKRDRSRDRKRRLKIMQARKKTKNVDQELNEEKDGNEDGNEDENQRKERRYSTSSSVVNDNDKQEFIESILVGSEKYSKQQTQQNVEQINVEQELNEKKDIVDEKNANDFSDCEKEIIVDKKVKKIKKIENEIEHHRVRNRDRNGRSKSREYHERHRKTYDKKYYSRSRSRSISGHKRRRRRRFSSSSGDDHLGNENRRSRISGHSHLDDRNQGRGRWGA